MKWWLAVSGWVLLGVFSTSAQHGHLNAGATNLNQQLLWVNGAIFASTSGFVRTMPFTNGGTYAGYFNQNISLTALAATTNNSGPAAFHADLGSFLQAEVVSVQGPPGGRFGFWETGALAPTFEIPSGTVGGTNRIVLSDAFLGAGLPGGDPFGHLHGRRFTLNQEGNYTVGFRVIDTSVNGPGGGPIHNPSDVLLISFASVPEPSPIGLLTMAGLGLVAWRRMRRRQTL